MAAALFATSLKEVWRRGQETRKQVKHRNRDFGHERRAALQPSRVFLSDLLIGLTIMAVIGSVVCAVIAVRSAMGFQPLLREEAVLVLWIGAFAASFATVPFTLKNGAFESISFIRWARVYIPAHLIPILLAPFLLIFILVVFAPQGSHPPGSGLDSADQSRSAEYALVVAAGIYAWASVILIGIRRQRRSDETKRSNHSE